MYVALHVVMTTATDLRMASPLPPLHSLSSTSKLDLNDRTLFAVFCFIKNFIGASGTSAVAIDNKIEQAMYDEKYLTQNFPKVCFLELAGISPGFGSASHVNFDQALAKDLVKSHLMFAVREEVEVLKEKIAELMDRINQLEMENTVLKANASQETLAQLSSSLQPPPSNAP